MQNDKNAREVQKLKAQISKIREEYDKQLNDLQAALQEQVRTNTAYHNDMQALTAHNQAMQQQIKILDDRYWTRDLQQAVVAKIFEATEFFLAGPVSTPEEGEDVKSMYKDRDEAQAAFTARSTQLKELQEHLRNSTLSADLYSQIQSKLEEPLKEEVREWESKLHNAHARIVETQAEKRGIAIDQILAFIQFHQGGMKAVQIPNDACLETPTQS